MSTNPLTHYMEVSSQLRTELKTAEEALAEAMLVLTDPLVPDRRARNAAVQIVESALDDLGKVTA